MFGIGDDNVASTFAAATAYVAAKCELVTVSASMVPVKMLPHEPKSCQTWGDNTGDGDAGTAVVATL